jgi:prophage regulatory protein
MSDASSQQHPTRFLRLPEVLRRIGICKSEIYARMRAGTFPKPINLTKTRVAWVETDVKAWQDALLASSAEHAMALAPTANHIATVEPQTIAAPRRGIAIEARGQPERLIKLPEVMHRIGLGKTTVYALMKAGEFPKPVRFPRSRVAWVESEIDDWVQKIIRDRDLQSESIVPIVRNNRPELIPPKRIGKSTMKNATRKSNKAPSTYAADCLEGRRRAVDVLSVMTALGAPFKAHHELMRLTESGVPAGVIVGFMGALSEAAMRGAAL